MPFRTINVIVPVKLSIRVDDSVEVEDVLAEMTYAFDSTTKGAHIESATHTSYEITNK